VIKVTKSQSINVTLENNIFLKNYARGPGGIFSAENLQENSSVLIANNNLFQDNFCQENGGIFYFVDVWYQVSLTNNTYQNNTSAENGGIGYIEQTNVSLLEQHSFYSGANFPGKKIENNSNREHCEKRWRSLVYQIQYPITKHSVTNLLYQYRFQQLPFRLQ